MDEYMGIKTPPYSLEAEQSVLGAMLIDSDSVSICMEGLDENDFYRPENREIFSAMIDLFEQDTPIDIVTVCEALNKKGVLESVGGAEFVATPSIRDIEFDGRKGKTINRRIFR